MPQKEFLKKGYTDASLRVIAQDAETSTSSIYTRLGDKEGLFRQIVEPAADGLKLLFIEIQETFTTMDEGIQRDTVGEYSTDSSGDLLDYMYAHFDEFKLLLDASYGTLFHNFVDELVDIEVVRHDMEKADAKRYIKLLGDYHRAGFDTVFWPRND